MGWCRLRRIPVGAVGALDLVDDEHLKRRGLSVDPTGPPRANAVIDRATHVETDVWIVLAARTGTGAFAL
jgi:hypothetical protein